MPVFLSYSRLDRDFVDKLAAQLIQHKVNLWLDRWELRVGDSLTSCIESAITGASALLIVLSRASVSSDWCRRELNAGLVRELEERRIFVLPVLKEDCDIPLFLRDKLYADFRTNPDEGLQAILDSLARLTNNSLGRIVEPNWHMDWAMDWSSIEFDDKRAVVNTRVTIVEQAISQPYSVLSVIDITDLTKKSIDETLAHRTFQILASNVTEDLKWSVLLEDQFEKTNHFPIVRASDRTVLSVKISTRRLGEDTGKDILFHAGKQIKQIAEQISNLPILKNRERKRTVRSRQAGDI